MLQYYFGDFIRILFNNFLMLFDMIHYNYVLNANGRILDFVLGGRSLDLLLHEDARRQALETQFSKLSRHAFYNFNQFFHNSFYKKLKLINPVIVLLSLLSVILTIFFLNSFKTERCTIISNEMFMIMLH